MEHLAPLLSPCHQEEADGRMLLTDQTQLRKHGQLGSHLLKFSMPFRCFQMPPGKYPTFTDILSRVSQLKCVTKPVPLNLSMLNKIMFAPKKGEHLNASRKQQILFQHMKRAVLQAGHIMCVDKDADFPSPEEWGWVSEGGELRPFWTDLSEASKACQELIKVMQML